MDIPNQAEAGLEAPNPGPPGKHRKAAVFRRRRRLEVLGAAVVSASLMHLVLLAGASDFVFRERTWPEIVAGSLLLTLIAAVTAAKLDRSNMRRPKAYVWFYPPWWCAVPLAGLAFTILAAPLSCMVPWSIFYGLGPEVFFYLALYLVALPSVGALVLWKVTTNRRPQNQSYAVPAKKTVAATASATSRTAGFFDDWRSLLDWIESDDKIESRDDDAFEHAALADQLAERLAHSMRVGLDDTAIALIGRMGSGKSSIMELVKESFREQPLSGARVEFVQVSLWPFAEPTAAVDGILSDLVHAIERVADALPLHGLPKNYVAVIDAKGSLFSALSNMAVGDSSPEAKVEQVGEMVTALGVQFVLVIEDIERFGESPKESGKGVDRIRPIVSLLYLLKQQPSVSVVIPTDYMLGPSDPAKLASAVEYVPSLEPVMAWRAVWTLRERSLSGAISGREWIDPASPKARGDLAIPKPGDDASWRLLSERRSSVMFPQAAICNLLSTPRNLKWALRDCNQAWRGLVGEIDFDVLLCLCVLRVFDHGIITLITDRQNQLRAGYSGLENLESGEGGLDEVLSEFDGNSTREFGPLEIRAIRTLLKFLFEVGGDERGVINYPQGISGPWGEFYWKRFQCRKLGPELGSDQLVLLRMSKWKNATWEELSVPMESLVTSGSITRFGAMLDAREKIILLEKYFVCKVDQSAAQWERRSTGWLKAIMELFRVGQVPSEDLKAILERLIHEALTVNLPLCLELEYRFAAWSEGCGGFLSQEHAAELRRDVRHHMSTDFAGNSDQLGAAINSGNASVLLHMAFGPDPKKMDDPFSGSWEGWPVFANELVVLAEKSPEIGIPQLLMFITDLEPIYGPANRHDEGSLEAGFGAVIHMKEKILEGLFSKPKVLRVLLDTKHIFRDDHIRLRLNRVNSYASEYFQSEAEGRRSDRNIGPAD